MELYGAAASLGFATLENIMYCISERHDTFMRAVTAVPAHASFGAIMGYYFSKQHFKGEKVVIIQRFHGDSWVLRLFLLLRE